MLSIFNQDFILVHPIIRFVYFLAQILFVSRNCSVVVCQLILLKYEWMNNEKHWGLLYL